MADIFSSWKKFPPLGNRISLGQVPYTLTLIGKGNCPLKLLFPLVEIFSKGRKYWQCEEYIFSSP